MACGISDWEEKENVKFAFCDSDWKKSKQTEEKCNKRTNSRFLWTNWRRENEVWIWTKKTNTHWKQTLISFKHLTRKKRKVRSKKHSISEFEQKTENRKENVTQTENEIPDQRKENVGYET